MRGQVISGIRPRFQGLSQSAGQISHVLLTRSPLIHPKASSFDLHVLSTPPAFVLSQDQTLRECLPVIGLNTRVERHDNHRNRVVTCTASSLCLTSKGISNPDQRPRPGMSTYLALTFGTLLSSQGTDTVFKPLSQALRVFRSVLRFVLFSAYQIRFAPFTGRFFTDFLPRGFPSTCQRSLSKAFGGFVSGFRLPGSHRGCACLDLLFADSIASARLLSSRSQPFESTSQSGPCQRSLWREEKTSRSEGVRPPLAGGRRGRPRRYRRARRQRRRDGRGPGRRAGRGSPLCRRCRFAPRWAGRTASQRLRGCR